MMEKKRIPEIRFDGFEEEWEEKRLGEMATFSKGNGYSKDDLTDNGSEIMLYGTMYTDYKTEIYSTNQFVDEKNNSIKSEGTEVVIPSSGETAIDIARASSIKSKEIILGGDLNIVYPDENLDNTFLALSLTYGKRKKELIKRAQGASIIHIKNDDIKQSKIIYPNISEQNKISNLISNIDNIIENISKEIKKVQDYKQSMLQKMFPKQGEKVPEIRFEGFEGEWEEKNLKEIVNIKTGTFNVEDAEENGKYTFFDRSQIIKKSSNYSFDEEAIIYPGEGACFYPQYFKGKYALHQRAYSLTGKQNILLIFLYYYLHDSSDILLKYSVGSTVPSLRQNSFYRIVTKIPSLEEQQQIGTFFQSLDNQISLQQQKLDTYKNLKKTLLDKMFI